MLNKLTESCEFIITDRGIVKVDPSYPWKPLSFGKALRKHMDDGVDTYRVPGLATTTKSTLLAIYDVHHINSHNLQGDIDIGLSRFTDRGNTWEPVSKILDMGTWGDFPQTYSGVADACILVDETSDNIFVAAFWMHWLHDTKTTRADH